MVAASPERHDGGLQANPSGGAELTNRLGKY
uniref:Uncharacterized protein n=1 Tax=Anguilla anguilla TaxID=7936 RepID=A0A0E9TW83_ANGAN